MRFTLQEEIPGLIDFHKAFDSLEFGFLVNCLKAFNFGNDFVAWIGTLKKIHKAVS